MSGRVFKTCLKKPGAGQNFTLGFRLGSSWFLRVMCSVGTRLNLETHWYAYPLCLVKNLSIGKSIRVLYMVSIHCTQANLNMGESIRVHGQKYTQANLFMVETIRELNMGKSIRIHRQKYKQANLCLTKCEDILLGCANYGLVPFIVKIHISREECNSQCIMLQQMITCYNTCTWQIIS